MNYIMIEKRKHTKFLPPGFEGNEACTRDKIKDLKKKKKS